MISISEPSVVRKNDNFHSLKPFHQALIDDLLNEMSLHTGPDLTLLHLRDNYSSLGTLYCTLYDDSYLDMHLIMDRRLFDLPTKELLFVLAHEFRHAVQYKHGTLVPMENGVAWNGMQFASPNAAAPERDYRMTPWEVDADKEACRIVGIRYSVEAVCSILNDIKKKLYVPSFCLSIL